MSFISKEMQTKKIRFIKMDKVQTYFKKQTL